MKRALSRVTSTWPRNTSSRRPSSRRARASYLELLAQSQFKLGRYKGSASDTCRKILKDHPGSGRAKQTLEQAEKKSSTTCDGPFDKLSPKTAVKVSSSPRRTGRNEGLSCVVLSKVLALWSANTWFRNARFEKIMDTSDQWIRERSGIEQRCL